MTQEDSSIGESPLLAFLAEGIKRLRQQAGLSQSQLAVRAGYSKQYISRAENPQRGLPSAELVRALDSALSADGELVQLHLRAKREQQMRRSANQRITMSQIGSPIAVSPPQGDSVSEGVVDVNRKQFLTGLVATVAMPSLISGGTITRIKEADVKRYEENLARLYALDDHYGATGEVYGLTLRSMRHLLGILENASYTPSVGNQLRSIAGQLMEHAGWLAFDAGHDHDARYWWLEGLHAARLASDVDTEIVVLASMSLEASRNGRGREAVELAHAAASVAAPCSTPRLRSILAAREALGHARAGDRYQTVIALRRAHAELQQDDRVDDPSWLDFWGPSDLAGHAAQVATYLGDLSSAEQSARDALSAVDQARHPRNHAIYQARYATTLIAQDRVDEAMPVLTVAALAAADFNSQRLTDDVTSVLETLVRSHGDVVHVKELSTWAASNLVACGAWPARF
jgi:transcriptional regulator with XRE-family HTH domain/tetratricopeptide (TPR) repeat protein